MNGSVSAQAADELDGELRSNDRMVTGRDAVVRAARLDLVSVGPAFVRAALERRIEDAGRLAGVKLPAGWADASESVLRYRLAQMERDPESRPWLLRLVVVRESGELAGYFNFHAPPGDRGWVEIGYQIEPQHRRRGYAFEAVTTMVLWAADRGVGRFRASVGPWNEASLAMVRKLGFRRTGEQWDEIDGEEYVFEASLDEIRRPDSGSSKGTR